MRDLSELNINQGGEPVRRSPPADHVISDFEREFGLRIPKVLLELLNHSNGGHPELDCYNPNDVDDEHTFAINSFFFLSEDREAYGGLWRETTTWRPYVGASALPIAGDGGGNILFLDLTAEPPPVKVCWHDENFAISELAPSLEELVDGLHIPEDYI